MTMTQTMSGAELKVRLGGLGLSPSWFGARLDVTMRTVVRWFDGDDVDARVAAEVEALSEMTFDEMRKIVADADAGAIDGPIVLQTYRTDAEFGADFPAEWHRMLTFRVMDHFVASGREVSIEYVS